MARKFKKLPTSTRLKFPIKKIACSPMLLFKRTTRTCSGGEAPSCDLKEVQPPNSVIFLEIRAYNSHYSVVKGYMCVLMIHLCTFLEVKRQHILLSLSQALLPLLY